jgi:Tfp pilus assembly PilM family ATPase
MSEVRSFSKIVLSGKTSRLIGLQSLLEEKLSVPIDYVSCFQNIAIDNTVFNPEELEAESLGLTTAMGLAQQRIGHG